MSAQANFNIQELTINYYYYCTLLAKMNWHAPGNKLTENQRKCTVTSRLKKLTY